MSTLGYHHTPESKAKARASMRTRADYRPARPLTSTYFVWVGLRRRCFNPNHRDYAAYGGRGITVCRRWADYDAFLEDMGERPVGTSIDRIDNDGNYEPSNCKWATKVEQCRNMRRSRIFPHNGESKTLTEWSKVLGINYDRLRGRLRLGWTFERAIE